VKREYTGPVALAIEQVLAALEAEGVRYLVVGGVVDALRAIEDARDER